MKNLKSYLVFIVIGCTNGFGQNSVENVQPIEYVQEIGLQNLELSLNINPVQIGEATNNSNSIYIKQIGTNNLTKINTLTDNGTISLIQAGNNNIAKLSFSALSVVDNLQQFGDNHYLAIFSKSPSLNFERTIKQSGYGQNLIIHGSNSLSEKMILNMKGVSSTIIIRNFN